MSNERKRELKNAVVDRIWSSGSVNLYSANSVKNTAKSVKSEPQTVKI